MGRLHLLEHNPTLAFASFQQADTAYPTCQKAMISMAQILIQKRKPRAALRRLNVVLERIQNRDLQTDAMLSLKSLAWAARRDAAHCTLLCAEYNNSKQQQQQQHQNNTNHVDTDTDTDTKIDSQQQQQQLLSSSSSLSSITESWNWNCHHLPIAIDRIQICLMAAPSEPNLVAMLDRAEFLLKEARQSNPIQAQPPTTKSSIIIQATNS